MEGGQGSVGGDRWLVVGDMLSRLADSGRSGTADEPFGSAQGRRR